MTADDEGWVTVLLPEVCPAQLPLQWGPADSDADSFEMDLAPDCNRRSDGSETIARLNNLGYPARENLEAAVRAFQRAYDVDASPEPVGLVEGRLPPLTRKKLASIYDENCDASMTSETDDGGGS